jgi:hypothetical protein
VTHESNLEVEVDASKLDWDSYKKLILELEDRLSEIDKSHSVKPELSRGRALKARYIRVTADERHRKVRFQPFPSLYSNKLKNLRAYVYELLNRYCTILATYGSGNSKRKVYVLPKGVTLEFINYVARLNEEVIGKLRKDVEEFRKSEDFRSIALTLGKYGLDPSILERAVFSIGDMVVDVVPIMIDYDVMRDEFFIKQARAESMKSLELLKAEVEKFHRDYVSRTLRDILEKLQPGLEKLNEGSRFRGFDKFVERLIRSCDSMGMTEISEKLLKPLLIMYDNPKGVKALSRKYFGTEDVVKGVKDTAEKLR